MIANNLSLGFPPWYAVRVRSNFERSVGNALSSRDLDVFVPSYRVRRRWSDRIKEVDTPLFPGYLFCRLGPADRPALVTTRGVVSIVGIGKGPVAVPDHEVEAIRILTESTLTVAPCPYYQVGQNVTIEYGPLAGLHGAIQSIRGGFRVIVSVTLLQRSIAAEIDSADLAPVRMPLAEPCLSR